MKRIRRIVIAALLLFTALEVGEKLSIPGASNVIATLIPSADAIVGRPLTPVSYAGCARRSVRRGYY